MSEIETIAKWVIDNRYAKSETEKVSDAEMYHYLVGAIRRAESKLWVSVKERLPEDCKNVLATINYDEHVHIAYVKNGVWHAYVSDEVEVMGDAWLKTEIDHNELGIIAWREIPQRAEWAALENNLY